MSHLRRLLALPVLAASVLLVGACSTSTSTGTKAKTSATTSVASQSTTGGASKTEPTNAATATTAAGEASPGKGKVHLTGSFCDMIKHVDSQMKELFSPTGSTDPADQLKDLKHLYGNIADAYHQLQGNAPSEVKADVDFGVRSVDQINEQVQNLTTFDMEKISTFARDMDTPEAQKHSDNLDAYAKDKCGLDPNADNSGSDTPN